MRLFTWCPAALVILAGFLALAGCGVQEDDGTTTTAGPGATASSGTTASTSTTAVGDGVKVRVYFSCEEKVCAMLRTLPGAEDDVDGVAAAAVTALVAGPTADEVARGVASSIPAGTSLLDLGIDSGVATVDLSGEFAGGGGSLSTATRLAELVFTLTQFPDVTGVELEVAGEAVTEFGSEGVIISHPMTRTDFESLSPAILVESPLPGEAVTSPVRVAGTSNTYEATSLIKILDQNGEEIAFEVVTATSGNGQRGDFDVTIPYELDVAGAGTIVAYEESAEDGSIVNEVRIPVLLE